MQANSITFKLGCNSDDFHYLQALCTDRCNEIKASLIMLVPQISVVFWTADLPAELIAVATFNKGADGTVSYSLDFSVTTL